MLDLVAIGELLIDFTPCGVTAEGAQRYAQNPGGAPANVAVAAARLGLSASFIGKVGRDNFGFFLRDTLIHNGVDVRSLAEDDTIPTTLAIVSVTPQGERSFTFYRKPGADIRLTWEDIDLSLLEKGHFMHFGSVALAGESSRTTVLRAAQYAREHGAIICYDPNYRPPLWDSEAEALHYMTEGLKLADIVKVSDEEMLLLTGEQDCESGSCALAQYGAGLILVTLGEKGAFFRLGQYCGYVPGYKVTVADTNGAGDTFLGAMLYQLRGMGMQEIRSLTPAKLEAFIAFANRAASLTTSRPGAIPAMPTLDEVLSAQ